MCYAIPGKIEEIKGDDAIVDYGGVKKTANITLVDNLSMGDYILVHAGFAIEKLDPKSAKDSLAIIKRAIAAIDGDD